VRIRIARRKYSRYKPPPIFQVQKLKLKSFECAQHWGMCVCKETVEGDMDPAQRMLAGQVRPWEEFELNNGI
jgi:hypothetical protein